MTDSLARARAKHAHRARRAAGQGSRHSRRRGGVRDQVRGPHRHTAPADSLTRIVPWGKGCPRSTPCRLLLPPWRPPPPRSAGRGTTLAPPATALLLLPPRQPLLQRQHPCAACRGSRLARGPWARTRAACRGSASSSPLSWRSRMPASCEGAAGGRARGRARGQLWVARLPLAHRENRWDHGAGRLLPVPCVRSFKLPSQRSELTKTQSGRGGRPG